MDGHTNPTPSFVHFRRDVRETTEFVTLHVGEGSEAKRVAEDNGIAKRKKKNRKKKNWKKKMKKKTKRWKITNNK